MKKYKTPNGQIVDESVLRQKYGNRFDELVGNGTFSEHTESDVAVADNKSNQFVTPNGQIVSGDVLSKKYGDRLNSLITNGTIKKKIGSNGTSIPADANTSLPQSAPTTSQSQYVTSKGFDFNNPLNNLPKNNAPAITTPDGISFNLTNPTPLGNSPDDIAALQKRVATKTATDQDIQTLATASGKSLPVTQAYIQKGKDAGWSIEANDNVDNTNQQIKNGVDYFNKALGGVGLGLDANDVIADPNKSATFLQSIKQVQQSELDKRQQAENYRKAIINSPTYNAKNVPDELPPIDHNVQVQTQKTADALTYNITKLTADEYNKNGYSPEQGSDLLHQRLDPVGYLKNQELRKPSTTPVYNPIKNLADVVMGSDKTNLEALNSEKAQYDLALNQGMRDLAIEKKAKGIATNDQSLIDEANTIIPKIKDDNTIIESSPMLMKQKMAEYINNRYAADAGILNNTDASGNLNLLTTGFGVNNTLAKKYLTEGGFYNNPAYKDLADEIVTNPASYLANNSPFGRMGSSFLKPFISAFNTLGDLTGIRTQADIHSENIKQDLFPEALTQNIKPSFTLGGHDFNLSNTLASAANLGGYAVLSGLTSGLGAEVGLSANAAERAGAYGAFFMPTVDDGLKEADKMGLTPAQSALYAGMKGIMFAEGGRLFEFGKVSIPINKVFNEALGKVVTGITDEKLAQDGAKEMTDAAVGNWVTGLKKYGIVASNFTQKTATGAGILSGFGIGDSMLKLAFGDKNTNPNDILPQAANGFIDGLFTMGLFGAVGLKGEIDNAKNSTYKGVLNKMVDNKDATQDILTIGLNKGLYDQQGYDKKMQILNTGIKAKNSLTDAIVKTGVNLSPDQKAVWVANATIEQSLRNQAEQPNVAEADVKKYTVQADNFKDQNSKILDGLTFDKFLQPNNDLYDAQKEHQQALADFTANQNPANEQVVLDKKAAVDNIISPAKIESAVIDINGKTYEGKNHAEAILAAQADGQDISQVNRQTEGKFKLSDGTVIDRAEAMKRFGTDRSEQLIPQDEAAKQADIQYKKINPTDNIQQGAATIDKTAPSIEDLKKVKLEGIDQKYKTVNIKDPVTGETMRDPKKPDELPTAMRLKSLLENRHDILTKLVNCLT